MFPYMYFCNTRNIYIPNMRIVFIYVIVMKAVLSNGFAFCLMWNVLENGYLEPRANTRIDFHRERGKVRRVVDVGFLHNAGTVTL